jgi:hypothetical protein
MAHSTLTIFCSEAELKIASVQSMWCGLWKLLDEKQKGYLWDRLEKVTEDILNDKSHFRTPEELVDWIIWPPSDEAHEGRDCIGECFANWFEERLEENAFDEMDTKLARIVSEYMPTSLQEPIRTLRKEMLRRLAE